MNFLPALLLIAQAGGATYTESQVVELAIQNSPLLASRGHQLEESEALVDVARRWENPELRLTGMRYGQLVDPALDRRTYGDHPFGNMSIGLRWSPPELGQRGTRLAEARVLEATASAGKTQSRRDVLAMVRSLHATILNLDTRIELAKTTVDQRFQMRDLIARRLKQNAATLIEKSVADMDCLDAQTVLSELTQDRNRSYNSLLAALGLPADHAAVFVSDGKDACQPVGEVEPLAKQAESTNPRSQVVAAEIKQAEAERSRKWLALVPWPSFIQGQYELATDKSPGFLSFSLGVPLPVFDWKRADRRASKAKGRMLVEELRAENRALADSVRKTAAEQKAQAAMFSLYQESSAVVEQGLAAVKKSIESGESTNLYQALQLQSRLLAARKAALKSELECKLNRIEIDRLTGSK
jgi:outer membrane protein TolC